MNTRKIASFEVIGLFGTDDVLLPFNEKIKILIGENGIGKTQVLNLLYYTLTQNFFKLNEFNFKSLKITFEGDKTIEIAKKEIEDLVDPPKKLFTKELSEFEDLYFKILKGKAKTDESFSRSQDSIFRSSIRRKCPRLRLLNENIILGTLNGRQKELANVLEGFEILYFPTYRRVEEELYTLGYDDDDKLNFDQGDNLIQFGMEDVAKRFEDIKTTIDKLMKEGFAQLTSDILNVMVDGIASSTNILDNINETDIEIILARVGNSLPNDQKEAIVKVIKSKSSRDPFSSFLLQKLIEIYEKQKVLDNSVKAFRDTCNKYLVDKSVFYDESAIDIYIKSKKTNERIDLKYLSSGEKQIVSMFSKVYLSEVDKRFIILFDEPELSLSMIWQKQLLPDIINSNKCEFLLAVTHSPFIFDNELDEYAIGMTEYIRPTSI